ncbi:MAG TPA: hypothetical protein EYN69_04175 [Flavobacteriales bacterium]|nr:hypothetical protein [Flavobacteriales bacterium]
MFEENIGGESAGQDIWFSSAGEDGAWAKSKNNLAKLNNKFDNAIIGIGDDEKTFYLLNSYKKRGKMGVSVTTMENSTWSAPSGLNIPGLESQSGLYGFYMHPLGNILMISMEGKNSSGKEDIYVCLKGDDGKWAEPINLGSTINSEAFEITPFLDAETNKLYFSTDGRNGLGSADVYVAERLDDTWTNWSPPENLEKPINSVGFDAFFSLNRSGDVFFASNRSGELNDIFYSNTKKVDNETEPVQMQAQIQSTESKIIFIETPETVPTESSDLQEAGAGAAATESVDDVMNEILAEGAVEEIVETATQNLDVDNVEFQNDDVPVVTMDDEAVTNEEVNPLSGGEEPVREESGAGEAETVNAAVNSEEEVEGGPSTAIENIDEEQTIETDDLSSTEVVEPTTAVIVEEEQVVVERDESEEAAEVVESVEPESVPEATSVDAAIEEPGVVLEENPPVSEAEEGDVSETANNSSPVPERGTTELVYFDHNSSYLGEKAQQQLRELSNRLSAIMSTNKIEVVGYSDNTGEQHYNLWITERRANRVIAFLAENGVEPSVFVAGWKGAENPLKQCSECTDEENRANRRVEIIVR